MEFTNELKDWEKEIVGKYPLIYKEPNIELQQWYKGERFEELTKDPNFTNLRYGFEFEQGWSKIVDKFSNTVQQLVMHLRSTVQPDAYVYSSIFKEKFGSICWQGDDNLQEPFKTLFRALLRSLERDSLNTCEITGNSGTLCQRGGWRKVLCREQAKEQGYLPINQGVADHWKFLDAKENECV